MLPLLCCISRRRQKQASWETGWAKHRGDKQSGGANNEGINKRQGGQTQKRKMKDWEEARHAGLSSVSHRSGDVCKREKEKPESKAGNLKVPENIVIEKKGPIKKISQMVKTAH